MDATSDIRPRRGPKLAELALTDEERATLERWARRRTSSQALAERCRIVLACAAGPATPRSPSAWAWPGPRSSSGARGSWPAGWMACSTSPARAPLASSPTSTLNGCIVTTLETTPADATHWSTRSLARAVGLNPDRGQPDLAGVRAQAASDRGLQALHRPPVHRQGPRHRRAVPQPARGRGLVLSVDEKTQVQALDRTAPVLPLLPGVPAAAHPRLRPPRHHRPVRRPGRRLGPGHHRADRPAPRHRVPALPDPDRPGRARRSSPCT